MFSKNNDRIRRAASGLARWNMCPNNHIGARIFQRRNSHLNRKPTRHHLFKSVTMTATLTRINGDRSRPRKLLTQTMTLCPLIRPMNPKKPRAYSFVQLATQRSSSSRTAKFTWKLFVSWASISSIHDIQRLMNLLIFLLSISFYDVTGPLSHIGWWDCPVRGGRPGCTSSRRRFDGNWA